jgi:hypothetical protein
MGLLKRDPVPNPLPEWTPFRDITDENGYVFDLAKRRKINPINDG